MSLAGQISLLAARIATEVKANKTAIALKAPIASPQFTGVPTSSTPAKFDSSTNIATTAFVAANSANQYQAQAAGGTQQYQRIATLDGGAALSGANLEILVGGVGNYGTARRGNAIVSVSQRGTNPGGIASKVVWLTTDPGEVLFYTVSTGSFTLEVWMRTATYQWAAQVTVLDAAGATLKMDSVRTTAPSGAVVIQTTADLEAIASSYAPTDSPTFTGVPKSITPGATSNSTTIATTAFVVTAIANAQPDLSVYAKKASPTFSGTVTMTQFTSANGGVTGTLTVPNVDAGNNQLTLTGTNASGASAADLSLTNDGTGPRVWSNAIMNRTYSQASSNGVSSSTLLAVVTNAGTIGALNGGLFLPDVYSRNRSGQRTMLIQSDGSMGTSSSSIRVKNTHAQVVMDDTMLEAWAGLPTWTFDYKEDPDHHEHTGVIAEEVQAAGYFDDLIYYDERPAEQGGVPGQVDGFAYERMGVWNRLAIGRLLARVKELEARIPA